MRAVVVHVTIGIEANPPVIPCAVSEPHTLTFLRKALRVTPQAAGQAD
jgi:hypothetical protein